jgi:serine phosphatase RsbU (regulator of sigma subunit)
MLRQHYPDSFILYRPKDIVSGDFYWMARVEPYLYLAAVDCTGHGVPGAFMSVLGSSQLNEVVLHEGILQPADILRHLNMRVVQSLQRNDQHQVRDGMDLSLCRINTTTGELVYAAANRPVLLHHNKEWVELKPDRAAIGHDPDAKQEVFLDFTEQNLQLAAGDSLYLFTDGVTDQFGYRDDKRLTKRGFIEQIQQLNCEPMVEQQGMLEEFLDQWQGKLKQTDDILVMGIRFGR